MPPPADVVVANILSNPLKLLAPMLASLVAPGGALVLSGVLERQIEEVAQFYAASLPVTPWRIARRLGLPRRPARRQSSAHARRRSCRTTGR